MKPRSARLVALALFVASAAHADGLFPPWSDPNEVPLASWAHSVAPKKSETAIFSAPGRLDLKRATSAAGARLPLYGAQRGAQCEGRWLHVGLASWICSDNAELSADMPTDDAPPIASDGLPYRYYFVGKNGAPGYANLGRAGEEAPDEDLDPGFAVATTDERTERGVRWVHTRHQTWIAGTDLVAARASAFHGEEVGASGLDFAWVLRDRMSVYNAPNLSGKSAGTLARREVVRWREDKAGGGVVAARISDDGATPARWVDAHALARPTLAAPPPEVLSDERWIDIELATQTLVVYDGARPVFATLVSTGAGRPGTDTATRKGTFRIWVKLLSSTMDNLESNDGPNDAHPAIEGPRYSIEDVPYVQFFDKAIALHGVFWHDDFG